MTYRIFYQDNDYDVYAFDHVDYDTAESAIAATEMLNPALFYAIYKYGISSDSDVMVRIRDDCGKMNIYYLYQTIAGKKVNRIFPTFMRYAIQIDERKFVYSSLPWGLTSS
jgi:hypothetical protein